VWIVGDILNGLTLLLLARVILEWVPFGYGHPAARVRSVLRRITDPLLAPIRALVPPVRTGSVAIDLSPMILMVVLGLVARAFH
jgi:YggT family protein